MRLAQYCWPSGIKLSKPFSKGLFKLVQRTIMFIVVIRLLVLIFVSVLHLLLYYGLFFSCTSLKVVGLHWLRILIYNYNSDIQLLIASEITFLKILHKMFVIYCVKFSAL